MPSLSSGLVIAGAYADKVRRTLFAQMKDYVKQDKTWAQRVAYAAAQLNRFLYTILVEQLKIDKGDVVRIRIEYDVDEVSKEIKWRWDTLQIEAFRRIPQEQVDEIVRKMVARAVGQAESLYTVEHVGKTVDDEDIYAIKIGDEVVGAAKVISVDGRPYVVTLVLTIPEPTILQRVAGTVEDALKMLHLGRRIEQREAEEMVKKLLSQVSR